MNILNQRDLGCRRFVDLADNRRDCVEPRPLRRAPPALPGDDHEGVAVRSQQNGLENPAQAYRFGEFVERFLVKLDARLVRIGADSRHLHLVHTTA